MKTFLTWTSPDAVRAFVAAKGSAWIFKHSTRCPISAEAEREFMRHPEDAALSVYRVLVVENRPTSNAIAEALGVEHQSPQAILVRDGRAVWNASHWDVTREKLKEAEAGAV